MGPEVNKSGRHCEAGRVGGHVGQEQHQGGEQLDHGGGGGGGQGQGGRRAEEGEK